MECCRSEKFSGAQSFLSVVSTKEPHQPPYLFTYSSLVGESPSAILRRHFGSVITAGGSFTIILVSFVNISWYIMVYQFSAVDNFLKRSFKYELMDGSFP